jgi:hypothetical protein
MQGTPDGAVSGKPYRGLRPWTALALVFLAGAAFYSMAAHVANRGYPEDDAFITYRYVDNLLTGRGLVYNEGQRVFGASTPLYVLTLALAESVTPGTSTPDVAARVNMLAYLAAGIGLWFLLRRLTGSAALAALLAGLFILRDDMLDVSTGGMEIFMFAALMLWSLWALIGRRFITSSILAGISVLVRLEGTLLCLVVLVAWLATDRRRVLPVLVGVALPGLVWIAFGFAYFGTPVYHSIIAKSRPLYPLPFGHALGRLFQLVELHVLGDMRIRASDLPLAGRIPLALTLITSALTGVAVWGYSARVLGGGRTRDVRLALPGLLAVALLFYLVTNPLLFPWYVPPVAVLWYLVVAAGTFRLTEVTGRRWLRIAILAALVAWSGLTALRAPVARLLSGTPLTDLRISDDPVRTRIAAYRAAAEWLDEVLPDGVTVAGPEVGSLGYYYKGPLIDACGLVSPEAVPFLPVPMSERFSTECGAISVELVRHVLPDVIVTMGTFAGRSLYGNPWFRRTYVKVKVFDLPKPAWNTPSVDVFFRGDHVTQ